jgi:hypothetical protein
MIPHRCKLTVPRIERGDQLLLSAVYGKANGSLVLPEILNMILGRWLTNGSVGPPKGPPNLNSRRWFSARFGTSNRSVKQSQFQGQIIEAF